MDAPCKIQGSIHVFRLVNNMCPGKWVHIRLTAFFSKLPVLYSYYFMEHIILWSLHFVELKRNYILLAHLHQTVLYGPVQAYSLDVGIQ